MLEHVVADGSALNLELSQYVPVAPDGFHKKIRAMKRVLSKYGAYAAHLRFNS